MDLEKVLLMVAHHYPEIGLEAGLAELRYLLAFVGDQLAEPRVVTAGLPDSLLVGSTQPGQRRRLPFHQAWRAVVVHR